MALAPAKSAWQRTNVGRLPGLGCLQRPCQRAPKDWPSHLPSKEFRIFSQNGEDGIIAEIFNRIGTTNQFYVEASAAVACA
jgi:hypothetical protein